MIDLDLHKEVEVKLKGQRRWRAGFVVSYEIWNSDALGVQRKVVVALNEPARHYVTLTDGEIEKYLRQKEQSL